MESLRDQKRWRVSRDEEGDYVLKCKYGVIGLYKDGDLDVWVKNTRIFAKMERVWKANQHWDDGGLFIRPYGDLDLAARYLKAPKKRNLSPEQRQMASERFARMRSLGKNPQLNAPTGAETPKTVLSPTKVDQGV